MNSFLFTLLANVAYARYRFLPSGPLFLPTKLTDYKRPHLLLVTTAFNKPELIDKQAELISLNVKDQDYRYLVVDNSTDKASRSAIKEVCQKRGIDYIAVRGGIFLYLVNRFNRCSLSHAFSLNWVYYKIIRKIKPEFFAFLDHDIFPITPTFVADLQPEEDYYGVIRRRGEQLQYWFLWPGWSVYRFSTIKRYHPDFNPGFVGGTYLDTGGANYKRIYSRYDFSKLRFTPRVFCKLKKDNSISFEEIYYVWGVEIVNNAWLHLINGSVYKGIGNKEKMVKACLNNLPFFQKLLDL